MQNYYNDYYQFGVWDGVKNTWNTIRAIPKIASGIGAIKDFGKTGDFNKLVDWGKENFKGNPMIDKAVSWAKDNKALLGGLATAGVGALANHFANKNNQKQVMMGLMPGMGGGMMPMMNPYMGMMPMMNPYMGMGMMPGMGGGYYTVTRGGGNNGNGFFGNLMQAATPLLAAYGINKWMNGQQKTEEEKNESDIEGRLSKLYQANAQNATNIKAEYDKLAQTLGEKGAIATLEQKYKNGYTVTENPDDVQERLNKLYQANPKNSQAIKSEFDSLVSSLGEKGAITTLENKYKGGYYEEKEETTPQTAADKIRSTFGQKRSWWDIAGKIRDRNAKTRYDQAISGMTEDQRDAFQKHIVKNMEQGNSWRSAINAQVATINRQGGGQKVNRKKNQEQTTTAPSTQAIANATTDSQDPTKNPYADFSYSPLDEIQGRFKDVYFGSWDFLTPETKKKDVKALAARIKPGDGISVNKGPYAHYAIYIGDGKVIEHTGVDSKYQRGGNNKSQMGSLKDFMAGRGNEAVTIHKSRKFSPETVVQRAKNAYNLKDLPYDAAKNNCEHFMEEILNGEHKSHQVKNIQNLVRGIGYMGKEGLKNYDKDIDKSAKKYSKMYKHI